MIVPADIAAYVIRDDSLRRIFGCHVFEGEINKTKGKVSSEHSPFAKWMATIGHWKSGETKRYLNFLRDTREIFSAVQANMLYPNPDARRADGWDMWSCGWAGPAMLPMANYLYYLSSYGIRGSVLECGCFKGGSTCCLSWVCKNLGLKLIAADSFSGLPGDSEDGYYRKGEYLGRYEEVRDNVANYGCIENVEFVKGIYSESLKGFNEDLMLIWLDVDLFASVTDALDNTFARLLPNGVVFSDGLQEKRMFEGSKLLPVGGEARALISFFANGDVPYKACYAGGGGLGLILPYCSEAENVLYQNGQEESLLQGVHE